MKIILIFLICSIPIYNQIKNIRKVDFNNFTYKSQIWGEVTVKDGSWDSYDSVNIKKGSLDNDKFYFDISIIYGDITKDNQDEAIIIAYSYPYGGTARLTEGFIFSLKDNKPVQIASLEVGDGCIVDGGGIEKVEVKNNTLIVQRCYPYTWDIFWKSTSYVWNVDKLNPVKCELIYMGYHGKREEIRFVGDNIDINGERKKWTLNKYFSLTTDKDRKIKLLGSKNVRIIVSLPDNTVLNKCDKIGSSFKFFAKKNKEYWIKLFDDTNYRDTTFNLTISQVQ
jgi:hypothetical protein